MVTQDIRNWVIFEGLNAWSEFFIYSKFLSCRCMSKGCRGQATFFTYK